MSTIPTPFNRTDALDRFERMVKRQKVAIGRRIKELRDERGWTQQELARHIPAPEVDAQYVSKWERGVYTPTDHLEALATVLGVDAGDILAGVRENGSTPDVMGALEPGGQSQLDRIERKLVELQTGLANLSRELAAREVQAPKQRRANPGSRS